MGMYKMNRGKKLFKLMAMLTVAVLFAVVGCDDSTDPDPEDALVGSWKMTGLVAYYGSSVASADSSDDWTAFVGNTVLTFNDDGTGKTVSVGDSTETTTWTYSATATEITVTEDGETDVTPYVVSGSTLTLTEHEAADAASGTPETWIVITFAKQ